MDVAEVVDMSVYTVGGDSRRIRGWHDKTWAKAELGFIGFLHFWGYWV